MNKTAIFTYWLNDQDEWQKGFVSTAAKHNLRITVYLCKKYTFKKLKQ